MPLTVDHAIAVLNRIHETDPTVLPALILHRVPCNNELADDPTAQVGMIGLEPGAIHFMTGDEQYEIGLLGILNGIFGVDNRGWGYIAAKLNENKEIIGFEQVKHNE